MPANEKLSHFVRNKLSPANTVLDILSDMMGTENEPKSPNMEDVYEQLLKMRPLFKDGRDNIQLVCEEVGMHDIVIIREESKKSQ